MATRIKRQPIKINLLTIHQTNLQATNGLAYPLRSLAWVDASIIDACVVHAEYGHLLLLTADGALFGINVDTGAKVRLCTTETDWLRCNPWESEDGASIVELTMRDDWTTPAGWINERHLALWGLADWDANEFAETGQGPGVRILDVTESKQSQDGRWPMDVHGRGRRI